MHRLFVSWVEIWADSLKIITIQDEITSSEQFGVFKPIDKIHNIQKYTFMDFYCSTRLLLVSFRLDQGCREEASLFLSD